jgi:hypothetical protein
MASVVRAFPVLLGHEEAARQFAAAVAGPRQHEMRAFFRRMGVCCESWHLQHTPHGTWVIVVTELTCAPEASAQDYTASQDPFDRWFKDQVYQLSGINPDEAPLGPPTETLFSWDGR